MIIIPVKKEIIEHCKKQLKEHNFAQRKSGEFPGTYDQQLTGIIGESVILDLLGLPWTDGNNNLGCGIDILICGKKIDVKTMGRTTTVKLYYVNNLVGLQKDYKTDLYIFCSFNKITLELTICGWVTKQELFKRASFFQKGSYRERSDGTKFQVIADLFEIVNYNLNAINDFREFHKMLLEAND